MQEVTYLFRMKNEMPKLRNKKKFLDWNVKKFIKKNMSEMNKSK